MMNKGKEVTESSDISDDPEEVTPTIGAGLVAAKAKKKDVTEESYDDFTDEDAPPAKASKPSAATAAMQRIVE